MNQNGHIILGLALMFLVAGLVGAYLNKTNLKPSINLSPSNQTNVGDAQYIKRNGYGKRTGPNDFECDPDEINNQPQNNLVGFKCSGDPEYTHPVCTTEEGYSLTLPRRSELNHNIPRTATLTTSNYDIKKVTWTSQDWGMTGCSPIIITKQLAQAVYLRCLSPPGYEITKLDFNNSVATEVSTKSDPKYCGR